MSNWRPQQENCFPLMYKLLTDSASYEYKNKFANKEAQFLPMGIPTNYWKTWPPTNILSMRNSSTFLFGIFLNFNCGVFVNGIRLTILRNLTCISFFLTSMCFYRSTFMQNYTFRSSFCFPWSFVNNKTVILFNMGTLKYIPWSLGSIDMILFELLMPF
jgi:hypothetical protein